MTIVVRLRSSGLKSLQWLGAFLSIRVFTVLLTHLVHLSHTSLLSGSPYCYAFSYLLGFGHYCCLEQFLLSHFRWKEVHCGVYTNNMNGPGLKYESRALIQDIIRYGKELGVLHKDNGNQGSNVSRGIA